MTADAIKLIFFREKTFILPAVATIFLHSALGFFLTTNWTLFEKQDWQIMRQPNVINAHLVKIENRNSSKQKTRSLEKEKLVSAVPIKSQRRFSVLSKPAPAELTDTLEIKLKETEDFSKVSADTALADLMKLVASEEQALQSDAKSHVAVSYANSIQRKVVSYWSRPPSARNGMECILSIQLVPTGEVITSSILKSSGNKAFDLSALNAVKKAAIFPELKGLSGSEFERHFRRFRLLFRPEDLRY